MASHQKVFMSQGDEATRYMERGVEGTRACWALDEATRILAETEPRVVRLGVSTPTEQFSARNLDLAALPEVADILRESLAAFVEGR